MYKISKSDNNITKLEQRLFSDLGFRERDHLQEWIAKNPDVLGEELLIIQKEFQGFNDTKERLDLLALDKEGGLIIIENKLDDTGTDVVWQGLKYTSYCSTLTNEQIVKIYQEYLDSNGGGDAKENILEFLERETDEDLLLNSNDQRIFFIANNYRKEVTSTVLWLLDHEIQIRCFKATPYSLGDELFLQIEQIIPLPETAEYMIDAKEKEKEKKGKSKKVEETKAQLVSLWSNLKEELRSRNQKYLDNVKAKPVFHMGFWNGNGYFACCIGRHNLRIELYINNDEEKMYFNKLYSLSNEIPLGIKDRLIWQKLEGKKSSRIKIEPTEVEISKLRGKWGDSDHFEDVVLWFADNIEPFYDGTFPLWSKVQSELK
jgi:hypothetical protein